MVKIFGIIFITLIGLLLVLFILAPTIISTKWGKEVLVSAINRSIPGKASIDQLSLGWNGPQDIGGVILKDPEGKVVLSLDALSIKTSFFEAIRGRYASGRVEFAGFNASLVSDSDGNTNLMRAITFDCCPVNVTENVMPINVELKHVQGTVDLSKANGTISIKLSGDTERGNLVGGFNIDALVEPKLFAELVGNGKKFASSLHDERGRDIKIKAQVTHFPVEIIDQIVALKDPKRIGLMTTLLGDELNIDISQKIVSESLAVDLNVRSPTLSLQSQVSIGEFIGLLSPTQMVLQLTPELMDELSRVSGSTPIWHLTSPIDLKITCNQIALPTETLSLEKLILNCNIELGSGTWINDTNDSTIQLQQVQGNISAKADSPAAVFKLTGQGMADQQPFNINISGTIDKNIENTNDPIKLLKKITFDGNLSGVPLQFFDKQNGMGGALSDWIGTKGDLGFKLEQSSTLPVFSLLFKSERIELPILRLEMGSDIALLEPIVTVLKLPASAINATLKQYSPRVQNPVTAQLLVQTFRIPMTSLPLLSSSPLSTIYKVDFNAEFTLSPLQLFGLPSVDNGQINNLLVRFKSTKHGKPEIFATATAQPNGAGKLYDLIGKQAVMTADASLGLSLDGNLNVDVFNFRLEGDHGRFEVSGEIRDGNRLIMRSPAAFEYTLTPEGFRLLGLGTDLYSFMQGGPFRISLDSSLIPLGPNQLQFLRLAGTVQLDDLRVIRRDGREMPRASVDNLTAKWELDGATGVFSLNFSGMTRLGENEGAGKLRGAVVLNHWVSHGQIDLTNAALMLTTEANSMPTQLISSFVDGVDLVPLLGHSINLDIGMQAGNGTNSEGSVKFAINSDNLTGSLHLALDDVIQLKDDQKAEFRLKLTQQSYAAFRDWIKDGAGGELTLSSSSQMLFHLVSLSVPSDRSFVNLAIEADLIIDRLDARDTKTQKNISLGPIKSHISSQNIADRVTFEVSSRGQEQQGSPMEMTITGALDKGFTEDGALNRQDLSVNLDTNISALPISLMCEFACLPYKTRSKLEALIGTTVNAKIRAQLRRMNGPLFLSLSGTNGNLTIDATLNNGYLTLNQNMVAQVSVTPQLGTHVLNELIPVIGGVLSSDHPIKLTIDKQGFSVPIYNASEKTVALGRGVLDMGKVRFSNTSQLAKVLSLLTNPGSGELNVWLTPAYFYLNQGVLNLERVDMLIADSYPLAAWGVVDFNRSKVNMVFALSGAAIDKAFRISSLPARTFLQIPFKGSLDDPSFDKAKAAARLSALVAQTAGGPQGAVIGTVLDIASGGLSEKTPPPTTNPLPWASLLQDNPDQKKSVNSIDEVTKGASKLLKKLIK